MSATQESGGTVEPTAEELVGHPCGLVGPGCSYKWEDCCLPHRQTIPYDDIYINVDPLTLLPQSGRQP